MTRPYILLFAATLFACTSPKTETAHTAADTTSITLKYADGYSVRYANNIKIVEVKRPFQGATSGYTYWLVPKGDTVPPHNADIRIVRTPLASLVCTSTSHIPLLDYLGESDKLTGFPTTDYISSTIMRKRIDDGKVEELGIDKGMNLERLAMLKPDMLMGYSMSSDFGQFKKVEALGVPVVINAEYLEGHPLGRAEWIKFVSVFFNKEKQADSVFNIIEQKYLEAKALADKVATKPTVLSGIVYGDAWFMPGGQNYAAKIFKDAGCRYLWGDDASTGFLELSFESVYEKAHNADLWIGVGNFESLKTIEAADKRYTRFAPFKHKRVYTYDARKGAKGGSEFLELGYLRPDLILRDLVKIAHPELLPGDSLYFHRKLE